MTESTKNRIDELKSYIEERLGHKVKGLSIRDMSYLSDDCFGCYEDLIGHRIDQLISIMKDNKLSIVP